jgi:hypothetical protein
LFILHYCCILKFTSINMWNVWFWMFDFYICYDLLAFCDYWLILVVTSIYICVHMHVGNSGLSSLWTNNDNWSSQWVDSNEY